MRSCVFFGVLFTFSFAHTAKALCITNGDCTSCTSNPSCGWCNYDGHCYSGDSAGANAGSLAPATCQAPSPSGWFYTQLDCGIIESATTLAIALGVLIPAIVIGSIIACVCCCIRAQRSSLRQNMTSTTVSVHQHNQSTSSYIVLPETNPPPPYFPQPGAPPPHNVEQQPYYAPPQQN